MRNFGQCSVDRKTLAAFYFLFVGVALTATLWFSRWSAVDEAAAVGLSPDAALTSFELPFGAGSEHFYWGSLIASMNPSLTAWEVNEIGKAVLRYSGLYELPPNLIIAIISVESRGDLFAISPRGAQGLMQVMPFWKKTLGIEGTLFDIDNNIRAGCHILADNIKRWGYKEGIARYYRGNLPVSGEKYFVKVQAATKETS